MSGSRNIIFKVDDIKLCEEKINYVTGDDWERRCNYVLQIEKDYMENEGLLQNIIYNLGEVSDMGSDNGSGEESSMSVTDLGKLYNFKISSWFSFNITLKSAFLWKLILMLVLLVFTYFSSLGRKVRF